MTLTPARAVAAFGCLVVAGVSTYFLAMVLGAIVLTAMSMRNVVSNIAQVLMMLICGVTVPVTFWPEWIQAVAQAVPLTHALAAVRVLTDAPAGTPVAGEVATGVGVALVVGTAWLAGAALLLERLAAAGRRSGSIEFAD